MKTLAEGLVFLGLATAVHAAVFAGIQGRDGLPEAAGDGGAAVLSLAAAAPSMAAEVARWTRPPEVSAPEFALSDVPEAVAAIAVRPKAESQAPRRLAPEQVRLDRPVADRAARAVTSPPAPLPAPPEPPAAAETGAHPAQAAIGAGAGPARGQASPTPVASVRAAPSASPLAEWGGRIRARIEAVKRRPPGARASGRTIVRITLARDGRLGGLAIARSSGNSALDAAALQAVRRAGRLPPAPKGYPAAEARFDLPITFR